MEVVMSAWRGLALVLALSCCAGAGAQPSLAEQPADISPAELARRQVQAGEAADCRKAARQLKGTKAVRENARLKCEAVYSAQRATWNDPARQLR